MAYDQTTRNRLQVFVSEARNLLSGEFTHQFQQKYGLDVSSGEISELERLVHLNDRELETAQMLRDTLAHFLVSSPSGGKRECLERMIREQAFTVLNRLCALRMAEAREIIIESLSSIYNSKGFQLYKRLAGTALGDTGDAYRTYIFSLFDELALDLPVLFDRFSPQGCIFPGEGVLLDLLIMMNELDLSPLWAEDETIGWIYQYFNSLDERRKMRAESQAPRNSRELAVRNQFFTPRYVVEFLTDNTLGRLWYEMTWGSTQLQDSCRYLVRRPQEIFLAAGKEPPELEEATEDMSKEEMLQQPVYIPYRRLKDPREILMLDPACGSMHFGLYAFDLYEKIYEEAWDLEFQWGSQTFERSEDLQPLRQSYASREEFLRDVPRLIVECNIHGVDIDSRAVQIAGLSLWLRAQRSWQCQGVKPQQRPQIRKSNVVCAEPMPGEKQLLEEFTRSLKPRVLGQLVGIIFEKMQLAGEAGSLLKIDEEIEEALNLAREEFQKELQIRNEERNGFFPDSLSPRQISIFDFTDLRDRTGFWNFAEQKLLDALREYAEQAEETEDVQKRLFAQDAARGFAFIDLFRKRYDVVLMNPPFGETSNATDSYIRNQFPTSKNDMYATFVERGLDCLISDGTLGAITNRTGFFLKTFESWRREFLVGRGRLYLMADLGYGVLDAMVETACYCIKKKPQSCVTPFFRVVELLDKAFQLENCVNWNSSTKEATFLVDLRALENVPSYPISYWINSWQLKAFAKYPSAKKRGFNAYVGYSSKDDFRFIRGIWEVRPDNVCSPNSNNILLHNRKEYEQLTMQGRMWVVTSKGGAFSPYYGDIHLLVSWKGNGRELHEYISSKYAYLNGNTDWVLHPEACYFLGGITWTRRTTSSPSFRVLPKGCMFSEKGPTLSLNSLKDAYYLLGILQTETVEKIIQLQLGAVDAAARSYEIGIVEKLPIPVEELDINKEIISTSTEAAARIIMKLLTYLEPSALYIIPYLGVSSSLKDLTKKINQYNNLLRLEYNNSTTRIKQIIAVAYGSEETIPTENEHPVFKDMNNKELSNLVIHATIGITVGRWDIRFATGAKEPPEMLDPFAPLPVCPPGTLQNKEGLPVSPQDVPDDYPIRISWSGILVDDEGHPEDIVTRVREAIEVIWKKNAENIEQEACEILGVDSLRDYFCKPINFFAEHLKRYSKSRRKAPIYWPLSTNSGSYTIWIYYQHLSDQTLYRCVNDYVEPKLKQITEFTLQLRQNIGRTRQEERELEDLLNLEQELLEFRNELLRVAAFWKPDLNDGVQITAEPLWKLFRLPKWRFTLKDIWEKLEKGDYDWAHLAYSIWPDRVRKKCKHDKSLAIAHDMEDIYEEPAAPTKKKGGRGKKNT